MGKLIAGIAIMLCFVYIGLGINRYYKERAALFMGIKNYLSRAAREITFNKTDFITLTSINSGSSVLDRAIAAIKDKIVGSVPDELNCPYLKKSECELLEGFFRAIASGDYDAQKSIFARYESEFARLSVSAEEEKTTKGKLYSKLVWLFGALLLILML